MPLRRVFILWTHPLFREAVQLLLAHPQIEWVGSSTNYSLDMDQVASSSPDTILVEEVGEMFPVEILEFLETSRESVRVVGLNLHDNRMRTYQRVERTVGTADDLLYWMLNDSILGEGT